MAILGMEGFDHYSDAAGAELDAHTRYSVLGTLGFVTTTATGTRWGTGKSLLLTEDDAELQISVEDLTVTDTMYFSFAFKIEDNTSYYRFGTILTGGTVQSNLGINGGKLYARLSDFGATLQYSVQTIAEDTWYWLDAKVFIDNTVGTWEVWVNGEQWIDFTGDTESSATTPKITSFKIETANARDLWIDDLVWQDNVSADFLGDSRIETFTPTGDTATTDWTGTGTPGGGTDSAYIDDIPPLDTDYIAATTATDESLYDFDTIADDDTVHAVGISYRAQKSDTGAKTIRSTHSAGSSPGATNSLGTEWLYYSDLYQYSTGTTDWTKASVGSATFGMEIVS